MAAWRGGRRGQVWSATDGLPELTHSADLETNKASTIPFDLPRLSWRTFSNLATRARLCGHEAGDARASRRPIEGTGFAVLGPSRKSRSPLGEHPWRFSVSGAGVVARIRRADNARRKRPQARRYPLPLPWNQPWRIKGPLSKPTPAVQSPKWEWLNLPRWRPQSAVPLPIGDLRSSHSMNYEVAG